MRKVVIWICSITTSTLQILLLYYLLSGCSSGLASRSQKKYTMSPGKNRDLHPYSSSCSAHNTFFFSSRLCSTFLLKSSFFWATQMLPNNLHSQLWSIHSSTCVHVHSLFSLRQQPMVKHTDYKVFCSEHACGRWRWGGCFCDFLARLLLQGRSVSALAT